MRQILTDGLSDAGSSDGTHREGADTKLELHSSAGVPHKGDLPNKV